MKAIFAIVKRLLASNKISFILTALVVLCQRPCGFVSAETVPYRTEGNSTRVKLSFYYYLEKNRKIGRSEIVNFL